MSSERLLTFSVSHWLYVGANEGCRVFTMVKFFGAFVNEHSIALLIFRPRNWMDPEALDSASLEWWFLHLSWTAQGVIALNWETPEAQHNYDSTTCLIRKSYSYSVKEILSQPHVCFFFLPEQLDLSSLTGLEYALKPKLISINTKEETILLCCRDLMPCGLLILNPS